MYVIYVFLLVGLFKRRGLQLISIIYQDLFLLTPPPFKMLKLIYPSEELIRVVITVATPSGRPEGKRLLRPPAPAAADVAAIAVFL